jgi:hypothetical protein
VDPRAGLDDVEKRNFLVLPGLELRLLGRPARSQSLYRPPYHYCCVKQEITQNFDRIRFGKIALGILMRGIILKYVLT